MHSPSVAIVILNWNSKKYLEQFLPSVVATSYSNKEIIIADNGSTDDSIDFVTQYYPSIRIIRLDKNYGFAKGYNLALQQVEADYYILLNSDVEVTPNWLHPMVALLENDAAIAACQPKILSYHHKTKFEYAGAAGGWIDILGYPFAKGRVFDVCEEDCNQYNESEPIFWATGAALFIKAEAFHAVQGFDEYFFAHQEEIDLCWRLQIAGYKIYSCPTPVVYHVGGGTLPQGSSLKTFLNFRNNHIMLSKNLPLAQRIWIMPLRFLLDVLSAFKELVNGNRGAFTAIFKAHGAVLKWLFKERRKYKFPKNRNAVLNGRYSGSIVWQYFIKKKNKFSEIVKKKP